MYHLFIRESYVVSNRSAEMRLPIRFTFIALFFFFFFKKVIPKWCLIFVLNTFKKLIEIFYDSQTACSLESQSTDCESELFNVSISSRCLCLYSYTTYDRVYYVSLHSLLMDRINFSSNFYASEKYAVLRKAAEANIYI